MKQRRKLETYHMSQYILKYFGYPVNMYRVEKGLYEISGPNATLRIKAENAASARRVLTNKVAHILRQQDTREHYDNRRLGSYLMVDKPN